MSEVWNHFKMGPNGLSVTCNHCNKFMKRSDSSTKSMWGHLKAWHIDVVGEETFRLKRVRRYRVESNSPKKSKAISHGKLSNSNISELGSCANSNISSSNNSPSSATPPSPVEENKGSLGATFSSLLSIESLLSGSKHQNNPSQKTDKFEGVSVPSDGKRKSDKPQLKSIGKSQKRKPRRELYVNADSSKHSMPHTNGGGIDKSCESTLDQHAGAFNAQYGTKFGSTTATPFPAWYPIDQQMASPGLSPAEMIFLANSGLMTSDHPLNSRKFWQEIESNLAYGGTFYGKTNEKVPHAENHPNCWPTFFPGFITTHAMPFLPSDISNNPYFLENITSNALNGRSAFTTIPECAENNTFQQRSWADKSSTQDLESQNQNIHSSGNVEIKLDAQTADCSPLLVLANTAATTAAAELQCTSNFTKPEPAESSHSPDSTFIHDNTPTIDRIRKIPKIGEQDTAFYSRNDFCFSLLDGSESIKELHKIALEKALNYSVKIQPKTKTAEFEYSPIEDGVDSINQSVRVCLIETSEKIEVVAKSGHKTLLSRIYNNKSGQQELIQVIRDACSMLKVVKA